MAVKKIIITGASGSMGSVAVRHFASIDVPVIMAVRNLAKASAIRENILKDHPSADIELRLLDIASLASIQAFVQSLEKDGIRASHLFNNAGIIPRSHEVNADGFEMTVATNYIGPYLLSRLAVEKLGVKNVCNMVSLTIKYGRLKKNFFENPGYLNRLDIYSTTKLALFNFSIILAKKYAGVQVNVSDPGIVDSNMISMGEWFDPIADRCFRPFISSPEKGVAPAIRAIESDNNLCYFVGNKTKKFTLKELNNPIAEWLWQETERILAEKNINFTL
ncbi:MAG: SDR family NAD(P)-dependent oxidoreductase [Bacteroidales bacterium]|nr:SDR family NAD(P)-dependent oxidoreductase [Bacteroidales bacterium]